MPRLSKSSSSTERSSSSETGSSPFTKTLNYNIPSPFAVFYDDPDPPEEPLTERELQQMADGVAMLMGDNEETSAKQETTDGEESKESEGEKGGQAPQSRRKVTI